MCSWAARRRPPDFAARLPRPAQPRRPRANPRARWRRGRCLWQARLPPPASRGCSRACRHRRSAQKARLARRRRSSCRRRSSRRLRRRPPAPRCAARSPRRIRGPSARSQRQARPRSKALPSRQRRTLFSMRPSNVSNPSSGSSSSSSSPLGANPPRPGICRVQTARPCL